MGQNENNPRDSKSSVDSIENDTPNNKCLIINNFQINNSLV